MRVCVCVWGGGGGRGAGGGAGGGGVCSAMEATGMRTLKNPRKQDKKVVLTKLCRSSTNVRDFVRPIIIIARFSRS